MKIKYLTPLPVLLIAFWGFQASADNIDFDAGQEVYQVVDGGVDAGQEVYQVVDGAVNSDANVQNNVLDTAPTFQSPHLPITPLWGGLSMNLGVPDAAGVDLVVRPLHFLRLSGGATYDAVSVGYRGGVTLLPFGWGPSFTAEAGNSGTGNANARFHQHEAVLNSVGYKYANLQTGLDLGVRRVVFFVHGGMSYFTTTVHGLNQQQDKVVFTSDPTVKAWIPSLKLGLIVYLF